VAREHLAPLLLFVVHGSAAAVLQTMGIVGPGVCSESVVVAVARCTIDTPRARRVFVSRRTQVISRCAQTAWVETGLFRL
jgi:hypothetical protein